MFLKSFLRLHTYRKFDYQPRHYDEKKEQREERLESKRLLRDAEKRISFRNSSYDNANFGFPSYSKYRIVIIAVVLIIVCYFFLRYLNIDLH